ncbi:MAG: 3-deoxy-manno-octulosonate cytidylyltransferase [Bdellovibrionales bacterium]|nr:3-deoxy-manno-octulosonate cytidylyltransferase [Bdellovibrionales bacterium]
MNSNHKPNVIGIIPARLESARLPRKPVLDIFGKSLVQRVWEQSSKASVFSNTYIATDSHEIKELAEQFGANVIMTSPTHPSGTDRIAEAVQKLFLNIDELDLVVNIQGDIPFINPKIIDLIVKDHLNADESFDLATLATPMTEEEFSNPKNVKVVCSLTGKALYFSRSLIPFARDEVSQQAFKHIGLYSYRPKSLLKITSLKPSPLERTERLEQLRALENNMSIKVLTVEREDLEPGVEVDTQEDLEKAIEIARSLNL